MTRKENKKGTEKKHHHLTKFGKVLFSLIAALCIAAAIIIPVRKHMIRTSPAETAATETAVSTSTPVPTENTASFTFTGVGDNLLHDTLFYYHELDYHDRDFTCIYQNTASYSQTADLAYINFETVCAGDAYGLSGYPMFNGPLEFIDALAAEGFDWFSTSSNHSMDTGMAGLQTELNYIHTNYPDIATTGSFASEEEANTPEVLTVNGIRVGLVGFTYGLNGLSKPEGADWLIDVYKKDDGSIDYDLMQRKIDAVKAVSDVQICAMHWGIEYQNEVSAEQAEIAQWLNQQGIEVIIGTHPHVIEPAEFITTPEQTTLVYYSLGNFVSAQDEPERMVGGMASFQLDYNFDTGETTFENVQFTPTVTWISTDLHNYRTNTIHEYNDEMAATHSLTSQGMDMTKAWVQSYVRSVMGEPEGIEIVYE
jgi:poly-gamma-glutamate synthesis protein (capsule biosynthesis protein)